MSKSKHTPGPWAAGRRGVPDPKGREWEVRDGEGWPITGWGCVRQTEANARLIAAAPDLLKALTALPYIESVAGRVDRSRKTLQAERFVVMIRAATEKATKKSPTRH